MRIWSRRAITSRIGLVQIARRHDTTAINPEDIEWIPPTIGAASSSGASSSSSSRTIEQQFRDVTSVDNFARARVINFIKRHGGLRNVESIFATEQVNRNSNTLFHCTIRIPLNTAASSSSSSASVIVRGEGLSSTEKDAELLAAMHAEQIIDSLGYQIYTLPSMQRKHAEAARSDGRWAPMPEDGIKPIEDVILPAPLRRIVTDDETENGEWIMVDTTVTQFSPDPHALISPCLLEPMSLFRIKSLFSLQNMSFEMHCSIREAPGGGQPNTKWFVCTIQLPITLTSLDESLKAVGKATDRHLSTVLAAMHAELVLDAAGGKIYPNDPAMQDTHAKAALEYGRWARGAAKGANVNSSKYTPPPGLKQLVIAKGGKRVSVRTVEEEWVRRNVALSNETTEFLDPERLDIEAPAIVKKYLQSQNSYHPYLKEKVGTSIKATLVLPVPVEFGVRGGVGLGLTAAEAELLAANHALDVLCALNINIFDSVEARVQFCSRRKSMLLSVPSDDPQAVVDPLVVSPPALRRTIDGTGPPLPTVSSTSIKNALSSNETSASPCEDYRKYRSHTTRELWDLNADFQDFIVVKARSPQGAMVNLVHTLFSPRLLDLTAKDRIWMYLASTGKRWRDVSNTKRVDSSTSATSSTSAQTVEIECTIRVPVPAFLGDRIAIGVGPDSATAEALACMHAELILDSLGVAMYADPRFQLKHASAAAKLGRRVPYEGELDVTPCDRNTPSPPYLKMPSESQLSWIEMVKARDKTRSSSTSSGSSSNDATAVKDHDDAKTTHLHQQTAATTSSPVRTGVSFVSDLASIALHLPSKVNYVPSDALDLISQARVQFYLRKQRAPTVNPDLQCLVIHEATCHAARLSLPVPERFGARIAVGVAPTKREAVILCFMHAEIILDALGIHIFHFPIMQKRHAERVAKLGRWAPLPNEHVKIPSSTPTPLPLSVGEVIPKPNLPPRPKANLVDRESWERYILACEHYVEVNAKRDAELSLQNEKVPRSGDTLLDTALEESEQAPLDKNVKKLLTKYCYKMNVQYPSFWKTRTVGPRQRRVCLTTVEVPGFEHIIASGCSMTKDASHYRAGMHICAILRRIDPDFAIFEKEEETVPSAEIPEINAASKREKNMGSYDTLHQSFTSDGKVRVIELYSICFGLQPPVVLNKQRVEGHVVSHTTTVEIVDEDGKTWVGKAEVGGRKGTVTQAYDDLFQQLQAGAPGFQSLAQLVESHSHLDPEHVIDLTFPDSIKDRMRELIRDCCNDGDDDDTEAVAKIGPDNGADLTTAGLTSKLSSINQEEIRVRSEELQRRHLSKIASSIYQDKFAVKRKSLSIHEHKEAIISTIKKNQVTIVCGTTGCGKTTQLPQYILDDATERGVGGEVSMIVTQPRRLSAVSIAQRIASERLESLGESCGYTIRLDSKPGRNINFVTSGVLLRLFHASPQLDGINYVVIDEIHERDINSDFLLILVRDIIRRRKDLRVVLMSATLSSEQFSEFFNGAPVINVVGYVHPVKEYFVEDIAKIAESRTRLTPLFKEALTEANRKEANESLGIPTEALIALTPKNTPPITSTPQKYGFLEANGDIDFLAVQFAVDHALDEVGEIADSSVLVFLPGWDEIVKAKDILSRNSKFHIITLHSSVGSEEQMQCFQPPPLGMIKLILSTNIAESGVTIDDVAVVVDLGRAKEKSYILRRGRTMYGRNEMGSMSQLVTVYASRANCVQRRGRVGRTRPGVCIRLYSKKHFDALHDFQTPEMLRQPLDALCLQILALGFGDPIDFLRQAIEPPTVPHVESAMRRLHELGAVTRKGLLTPLGLHLAKLPVAPRIGKMILVGAVLRCLDSALTVAACSDSDVYSSSREVREAVNAHREDLSNNTLSDHISSINGFNYWVTAHYTKPPQEVMFALQERLLSVPQLLTVSRYKKQFFEILCHHGFLPDAKKILRARYFDQTTHGDIFVEKSHYSEDKTDVGLVKCVIGSGLFPNICMYRGKKLMRSKLDNRLQVAGSSVVSHCDEEVALPSPFFAFEEVVKQSFDAKSDRLVLRNVTSVPIWAVLLMGTSSMPVTYREDLNLGIIDDWIVFRASYSNLDLVRNFRSEFNRCLTKRFTSPSDASNNHRLEEFRKILKELASTALRPNELTLSKWEEKGTIIEPVTEPLAASESTKVGDTSPVGDTPVAADADES